MSFEIKEVDKRLIEILEKHKIYKPTEIQKKAIPFIVNKHDVLGISKTGTGKTLAFILPILTNLLKVDKSFYCLIITPTRELSLQINKAIKMFEGLGIRSCVLIGGDSLEKQFKDLETHPHIVLGTPGRIFKHTNLKFRRFKVLILDEADKFFEDDFKEEMKFIFEKLKQKRQNIFFTATCSGKLELACKRILNNSKIVDVIEDSSKKIEKLDERYVFIPKIYKECWIYAFLKEKKDSRIIIFVNMRTYVLFLSHFLKNLEIENRCLSGEQKQSTREEILDGFRKNQYNILISTDVGSRGIDIPDIDFVINYDIPYSSKDYIHRIGRTARAGKEGKSIVIVTQYDVPQFQKIEHEISRSLFEYDLKLNFREYHEMINLTILKANEEVKRDNEEKKKDQNRNEKKTNIRKKRKKIN